jgi:hypothetical protein
VRRTTSSRRSPSATVELLELGIGEALKVTDVVWVKEKVEKVSTMNPLIVADVEALLETETYGPVIVECRLIREFPPRIRRVRRWRWIPFFKKDLLIPRPDEEGFWGVNPASMRIAK